MDKDTGTIAALMIRLKDYRLPRARRILEQVNAGEPLSDENLDFLKRVLADARKIRPLVERHPEYHGLVSRMISLYSEIVGKALENEEKTSGS